MFVMHPPLPANLLLAYAAYFVGTASPGPSNLAIMSIAASHGRKAALAFALGVISGSMFWATIASAGISTALMAWSQVIVAIKVFGGMYLLWLAFRSGRAAMARVPVNTVDAHGPVKLRGLYVRGALMHLTNPKAILVWVSIIALSSNRSGTAHAVIPGCAAIGCTVFSGYAVLFSMGVVRRAYVRTRRALDGCLAVVFGIAGLKLLPWPSR